MPITFVIAAHQDNLPCRIAVVFHSNLFSSSSAQKSIWHRFPIYFSLGLSPDLRFLESTSLGFAGDPGSPLPNSWYVNADHSVPRVVSSM